MVNLKLDDKQVFRIGPTTLYTDASEQGLPPGHWPTAVEHEQKLYKYHNDIHAPDGEFMGRKYTAGDQELAIYND